jgi:TRAP-type C4-dicarboxylate transport system substrate-binding protein
MIGFRLGNDVPQIAILNGPYFVENLDDVAKLRKSPTVRKYGAELADKHGLKEILESEAKVAEDLKKRDMTILTAKDIDMAAFSKAGDNAYDIFKITDAREAIVKKVGKK